MMKDTLHELLEFLQTTADRLNLALNPDEKALHRTASAMAQNLSQHGRRFCPCKQHHPLNPKLDPICPCYDIDVEIRRDGHCDCHIFFDPDAAIKAKQHPGLLATVTCPG